MPESNKNQERRELSKSLQILVHAGVELVMAWNKYDNSISKHILSDGIHITESDRDLIHKKVIVVKAWDKVSKRIDKMVIKNMDEREDDKSC